MRKRRRPGPSSRLPTRFVRAERECRARERLFARRAGEAPGVQSLRQLRVLHVSTGPAGPQKQSHSDGGTMKITRRFTEAGKSPYERITFRRATSEIKNPDGSVVFKLDGFDGPGALEPGRRRHPRAEILPQGRRARASEATGRDAGPLVAVALRPRRARPRRPARKRALRRRDRRPPGVRPPRRHLDLLGLEGRLLHHRGRRARLLRRAPLHAGHADGAPRTARSGSTPACTGPTASTVPARATSTSITRPAS